MDKEKRYCVTSKTMSLPSILVHLHILLMTASSVFSYVHFTEENFPGNPDISLQKMTLDPTTNTLYVGSVNRLYKLNSDLEEEIHRDTGPVSDHPTCFPPPGQCTTQEFSREATNNIIKILLVDNNRLITCGSVYQGTCQVRSLEDFTPLGNNTSEEIAANTRIGTSVGFISRGPENRANVLYTATSSADWIDNNVPTVSVRSLPEVIPSRNLFSVLKTGFRAVSQIVIPAETVSESPNGFNITYVYGFPSGNFSYFVGVQPENHRTLPREVQYYTKLIRICQRDINLLSYIELPLKCYSGGVDYNIAQSAYIAKAGKDGGEPWQNEDALFVTFAQSEEHDREPQRKSAVCMYLVSDLNQAFFDRRRECVNGHQSDTQMEWYKSVPCTEVGKTPALLVERMDREGRNYCHTLDFIGPMGGTDSPIIAQAIHVDDSTLFTAIAVSHKPQESAIFVGDDTGHLLKLMLTSQSKASVSTDHEIVPDGSVVQNGLLLSLDEEYVYVMTQRQITKLPVEECSNYTTCSECVEGPNGVGDPYCGWCTLQARCTRLDNAECTDSRNLITRRWLGWKDQCIDIKEVDPPSTPTDTRKELALTVTSLPKLKPGEYYHCLFDNFSSENAIVDTEVINNTSILRCNTPPVAAIPDRPHGSQGVKLAIQSSETRVRIAETEFVFYKCSAFSGCMECVDNHFECEWCVFDNVCHSKTEECASSQLGRVTGPETCPHILNNTEVLIPVGVEQSFKVQAANLPGDENLPGGRPISYKCVLDYEGREVSVPATRLSNSLLECHSESYTFQTEVDQLSVVLSVQWNDIIRIDNPSQFSVILYKCDVERPNCGVCISADAKYQCGWCESTQQCSIDDQCSNWYSGGDLCPTPRVTSFSPRAGPVEGQTNLTIRGINLGQTASNIHNITVAGHPCDPYPETYITATEIVCMTQGVSNPLSGPIIVRLASENKTEEGHSEQDFRFVVPKIISHRPILGPASGGTRVTITGHDLDAASSIKAVVADHDCTVVSISQDSIVCVTSPALPGDHGYVGMRFDGRYVEGTLQFTYNPDPTILSIKRFRSIKSGGVPVRVEGTNLNVIQNPQMIFRLPDKNFTVNCTVSSPETMFCPTPNMSASSVPLPYETRQGQYGLILDGVKNFTSLEGLPGVQPFEFVSDPYYQKFHEADHIKKLSYGQPKLLTILGENLTLAYEEKDVEVLIGDFRCQKILLAASKLSCDLPDEQPQSTNGDLYPTVLVRHGNLEFYVGKLHYEPKEIPWILIIGVAAGSLLAIIIFMMTLVVYCRKANANERLVKQLEQQRDTLEMKVAKECKEAFAELQTSVNTVTSDLGCGIPFHSYHIYAMKTMFPDQPNHPVLRELPLPRDRKTNSERGLQMFGQLIDNKTFLLCLIQTLEEQRTFNLRDVSAVASLLMVVLQSKMDYATDIMKVLLERLIEKHLEKDRARLLMRRNESVAEKMVSNWLSFLLYNFLVDSAGEPLFTLFYGIKQQVEMGPIDSITGEARYGLSEVKIIRQTIENKTLTIYAMGLDKDADPQQVKVHTCDSISQVKEKILDSIYRTTPYSHRPPKEELDLEWRCGLSGRKILPEDNGIIDGEWKRLTMLSDEQVRDGDTIALVPKQGFTMSAFTSPTTGRYTASPCRSTTPMLGSSDVENGVKLWHLVKQSDHDNMKGNEKDHKMMAEIYLPRLLTTKVTLQKFVDDLFETIFSVNYRSNTLPRAIKYLFDFFDDQAKQHGITNPEVVHSWKSNSLPLRFWVNLIKNPQHIFDIYKSDTVDACLSIVGQCLMDACSVSEHQLTKDSPSSKLLYAKDIPKYKEWVARYYDDIKNMPPISDQDMNAVLAEHSNSHQYDFHKLSALNELYHTYAKKYGEQISESLQRDEFGQKYKLAEKFEHVEQLMIDSESNHTI